MAERPLGRVAPPDWAHVEKYPLTAETLPEQNTPVVLGINWYRSFDNPIRTRNSGYVIKEAAGGVRGGHAVTLEPYQTRKDTIGWWHRYDQGAEGACVGFACSRAVSIFNRRYYDAFWLYNEAKKVDPWPGEDYEGTAVSAAFDVLRSQGHRRIYGTRTHAPDLKEGIQANRWARSIDDIRSVLGYPDNSFGPRILNSWGRDYPHRTRIAWDTLERVVFNEDGEAGIVTDR